MVKALRLSLGHLVLRLGSRVHTIIALMILALIAADLATVQSFKRISGGLYDTLIAARPVTSNPDARVVILDIDEGSLAEVGKTYGRWPWPNHVFGKIVEELHQRGASAIVFDVIFSDPDRLRPESDAAFNRTITQIGQKIPIFFPMVRLDPANDAKSQIPTEALPGARRITSDADQPSTIAVLLPQVHAALDQGRLGFLNVYPDKDSVIRRYPTTLRHAGWEFDSYAAKIARDINRQQKTAGEFLINWKGKAFTYEYISAKDLLVPIPSGASAPSLQGKVVLIGSSAPALQDLKATPVGSPFPGLEILATAIDNLMNDDTIESASPLVTSLIALGFIGLLTYLFSIALKPDQINLIFLILQAALIFVAWLLLSFNNFYLNLSGAVTYGAAFFAIAKIVSLQLAPLGREAIHQVFEQSASTQIVVHALVAENLNAKQIRYLNERIISKSSAVSGSMIAPILETEEDAGIFSQDFQRTLMFIQFAPGQSKTAPDAHHQELAQAMIRGELDTVVTRAKVSKSLIFPIDITSLQSTAPMMLGPVLYAACVQRLTQGDTA